MKYTAETVARKILGPYTGRRIAGTSEHVFDALATIEYRFDGFTVTISDIPVRWDVEHKRQFISGKDGVEMHRKLEDLDYLFQRQQLEKQIESNQRKLERLRAEQQQLDVEMEAIIEGVVRDALMNAPVRLSVKTHVPLTPAA